MSDFLGEGVSRTLSAKARQFVNVVWQKGKPPLDSELNLMSQISEEARQILLRENVSSGWVGNVYDPMSDYMFNTQASNLFWLGKDVEETEGDILWANVNGWLVPVVGTASNDTRNAIKLPPPQGTVSDSDVNFVFLEVWQAQISPDGSENKPSDSLLYRYGNTEYGGTNVNNDLLDPAILFETTERVQLQYRIRVVPAVNPSTSPFGFNSTIKGQGTLDNPTTSTNPIFQFQNMRDELGDPGLWRAGDGDGEDGLLETVDGYSYAIPICFVFRRSTLSWARTTQHGAVNRNPSMTDRSEAEVLPTVLTTATIDKETTTITVDTTQSATTFSGLGGLLRIDGEIIEYSDYSGTTITVSERGAKNTYATRHESGSTIEFVTGHPMGLFSDQIVEDDVLDLRHMVSMDGLDYDGLLHNNFKKLLKGELKTSWKKSVGDVKGKRHFQIDFFGSGVGDPDNLFKADEPDGLRKVFSDACTLQPNNLMLLGSGSSVNTSDLTFNPAVDINRRSDTAWNTNDVLLVDLDQYRSSFNTTDQNKVRFVHPFEYEGSPHDPVRLWFGDTDPTSSDAAKQGPLTYSSTDPDPFFVVAGEEADELVVPSSGTNDLTFTGGDTVSIPGVDFSTIQEGTATIVEYLLASGGAWLVISGAGDPTSTNPENHGIFRIDALSGTNVTVTRADGTSPGFSANTNNRQWSIRRDACTETDDDLAIGLVHPDPLGLASEEYAGDVTLATTFDLLYHPSRGLSKIPEDPLYVELDPALGTNYLRENDFQNVADSPSATVKKSPVIPMVMYPHKGNTELQVRNPQDLTTGPESVWAEAYVDSGSKTLLYQPVRNISARLEVLPNPSTVPSSDVTGLFELSNSAADSSVIIPKELRSPLGRIDMPFVTSTASVADDSSAPAYGINFMMLSGSPDLNTGLIEQRVVAVYDPVNLTETDFGTYPSLDTVGGGPAGTDALVCRYYNKGGVRGIELPPNYGIARLFAIELQDEFYNVSPGTSLFSPGSNYRVPAGLSRLNLLREDGERRSLIITDENTFVIPEDVIDQKFLDDSVENSAFIFEFATFFFDDWTSELTRLHRTDDAALVGPITAQMFVNGPAEPGAEFVSISTRVPYQGNIHGTMGISTTDTSSVSFDDYIPKRKTDEQADIVDLFTPFDVEEDVRVENPATVEILAVLPFATTLGTGLIAGSVEPGSYTDTGYLSLEGYPFTDITDPDRVAKTRAHPYSASGTPVAPDIAEWAVGLTERLPMGMATADYQFLGEGFYEDYKRFWMPDISLEEQGDIRSDSPLTKTWGDGDLIVADGTSGGGPAALAYEPTFELYRTYRGGVAAVGGGHHSGGAVLVSGGRAVKDFDYLSSPDNDLLQIHGGILFGLAVLVRNKKELVTDDDQEASYGDELQMLILTGVNLGQELDLSSGDYVKEIKDLILQQQPYGLGEGYGAADRFRIQGRVLQKRMRNKEDGTVYNGRDPSSFTQPASTLPHCP